MNILSGSSELSLIDFISKYNFEKALCLKNYELAKNVTLEVEVDENVDTSNYSQEKRLKLDENISCNIEINHNLAVVSHSDANEEAASDASLKKNDLYHFLNSSLDGRIILGVYKNTKTLDSSKLKDLLIMNAIEEDPLYYK